MRPTHLRSSPPAVARKLRISPLLTRFGRESMESRAMNNTPKARPFAPDGVCSSKWDFFQWSTGRSNMNKLLWGSLSLALIFAVSVHADDKKTEEKKEDKKQDAPRRQRSQRQPGTFQFPGRGGAALISEKEMEELKL